MRYEQLGKSDLQISVIGMGCWAIGGKRWGPTNDVESIAAVRQGLASGVNFFDTADFYGFGHSEAILGQALGANNDAIIASKVGLRWNRRGKIRHDLSPKYIKEACERSLRRLRRETIDLYQLHWPDPERPTVAALQALAELKDEGKIRYGGLCNFNIDQLTELDDYPWLVSYQGKFNLFVSDAKRDILPFCVEKNLGFIAYEPLFKGLLTGKYKEPPVFPKGDHRRHHDRFNSLFNDYQQKIIRLQRLAKSAGLSLTTMALALLIDQAGVAAVIPGAKTATQVAQNTLAADIAGHNLTELAIKVSEVIDG